MFVFAHQNVLEILGYFAIAYMLACSEHLWTAWVFFTFLAQSFSIQDSKITFFFLFLGWTGNPQVWFLHWQSRTRNS